MLAQLATHPAVVHAFRAAATSTTIAKKSSGSSTVILFLVVILAGGYFLYMRPRSRARLAKQQTAQQRPLEVGDEVATSGGIVGTVRQVGDDRVELEISAGMRIQVLRQNVGRPLAGAAPGSLGLRDRDEDGEADEDGDAPWQDDTSSALAPGGLVEEDGDGVVRDDDLPPAAPAAAAPAGAGRARGGRRRGGPASTATSSGWSRTSDEASGSGKTTGSSATGG